MVPCPLRVCQGHLDRRRASRSPQSLGRGGRSAPRRWKACSWLDVARCRQGDREKRAHDRHARWSIGLGNMFLRCHGHPSCAPRRGLFPFRPYQTRSAVITSIFTSKGLLTLIHHINMPSTLIPNHSIQPTRRPCSRTRTETTWLAEPSKGGIFALKSTVRLFSFPSNPASTTPFHLKREGKKKPITKRPYNPA